MCAENSEYDEPFEMERSISMSESARGKRIPREEYDRFKPADFSSALFLKVVHGILA